MDCFDLWGSFDVFVFQVIFIKLQIAVQKNNLSTFNLGLIWFNPYNFLIHAAGFVALVSCVG